MHVSAANIPRLTISLLSKQLNRIYQVESGAIGIQKLVCTGLSARQLFSAGPKGTDVGTHQCWPVGWWYATCI